MPQSPVTLREGWDLPAPLVHRETARAPDIDVFEHVNNAVFVDWLQRAAWSHSRQDGLDEATCLRHRKGMAIVRAELDFLAAGKLGDVVEVGVWITKVTGGRRAERRYQARRLGDGVTLVRARQVLLCFDLDTGKPARMPDDFLAHYRVDPAVAAALDAAS